MRKLGILLFFVILAILFMEKNDAGYEIRYRVIANSNREIDQRFKEDIMLVTYHFLEAIIDEKDSSDIVLKKLNENIFLLEAGLQKLDEHIEVTFGKHFFPVKVKDGKILESKSYDTLLIKIGEAKGDNYWSTIFPSLLGLDCEEASYKSYIAEWLENLF